MECFSDIVTGQMEKVMNRCLQKGTMRVIIPFLFIFGLLLEPAVSWMANSHGLRAQEATPDTLSLSDTLADTILSVQTADSTDSVFVSPPYSPRYILPDTVEGYLLTGLGNSVISNCPNKEVLRGASMDIRFEFLDDSLLNVMTPIFVTILEVRPDRSVIQVYREQFLVMPGKNLIQLQADFPPGSYQIIYGFYLRDQLNDKYPRLYGKRCRIRVVEVSEQ